MKPAKKELTTPNAAIKGQKTKLPKTPQTSAKHLRSKRDSVGHSSRGLSKEPPSGERSLRKKDVCQIANIKQEKRLSPLPNCADDYFDFFHYNPHDKRTNQARSSHRLSSSRTPFESPKTIGRPLIAFNATNKTSDKKRSPSKRFKSASSMQRDSIKKLSNKKNHQAISPTELFYGEQRGVSERINLNILSCQVAIEEGVQAKDDKCPEWTEGSDTKAADSLRMDTSSQLEKSVRMIDPIEGIQQILKNEETDHIHFPKGSMGVKINEVRIEGLKQISRTMATLGASSESFYLAVEYFDDQLSQMSPQVLQKPELVAYAAVELALKLDDEPRAKKIQILTPQYSDEQVKQASFHLAESLQFRMKRNTFCFWIDALTTAWDFLLTKTVPKGSLKDIGCFWEKESSKMASATVRSTFMSVILDKTIYSYSKPDVVLSVIYLVLRMLAEQKSRQVSLEQSRNELVQGIAKSSNILFCECLNLNETFGSYLSWFQKDFGDLLPIMRILGKHLRLPAFQYVPRWVHVDLFVQ